MIHLTKSRQVRVGRHVGLMAACVVLLSVVNTYAAASAGTTRPSLAAHAPYCGIYSVYAAALLEGHQCTFDSFMRNEYVGCNRGSTLEELKLAATDHGLSAVPAKNISSSFLRDSTYPIILNVKSDRNSSEYDHWVLFLGARSGSAAILNSGKPIELRSFESLEAEFNGIGLIISSKPITKVSLLKPAISKYGICAAAVILFISGVKMLVREKGLELPASPVQMVRKSIGQCGIIVLVSICISFAFNLLNPVGLLAAADAVRSVQNSEDITFLRKIDLNSLRDLMHTESAQLIDARMPGDYRMGHIGKAINIPVDSDMDTIQAITSSWDRNRAIVIYCQSNTCPYAGIIARKLDGNGFTDLSLFKPGWAGWDKAVRSGAAVH